MRLLNTFSLDFEEFVGTQYPPYAILSHTWGPGEVTYQQFISLIPQSQSKPSSQNSQISHSRTETLVKRLKIDGLFKRNVSVDHTGATSKHGRAADHKDTLLKYANELDYVKLSTALPQGSVTNDQALGMVKILKFCQLASKDDIEWVWIDTCCINKESSAELSEAINSMFTWYHEAIACWVYMVDFSSAISDIGKDQLESLANSSWGSDFMESRWFKRGWTLQELLAPRTVHFFDKDWKYLSDREHLAGVISTVTGISEDILVQEDTIDSIMQCTVAERMGWFGSKRDTTRPEDVAYSLLGIFSVQMSLLYGEGENAFIRLQKKISKLYTDETLFAWNPHDYPQATTYQGIFAPHPAAFVSAKGIVPLEVDTDPVSISSRGLGFLIYNHEHVQSARSLWLPLNCRKGSMLVGISLKKEDNRWYRDRGTPHHDACVDRIGFVTQQREIEIYSRPETRQTIYVSITPSRIPVPEFGLESAQRTRFMAMRLRGHMVPWVNLSVSIDQKHLDQLQENHPHIENYPTSDSLPIEALDTGKVAVVVATHSPAVSDLDDGLYGVYTSAFSPLALSEEEYDADYDLDIIGTRPVTIIEDADTDKEVVVAPIDLNAMRKYQTPSHLRPT